MKNAQIDKKWLDPATREYARKIRNQIKQGKIPKYGLTIARGLVKAKRYTSTVNQKKSFGRTEQVTMKGFKIGRKYAVHQSLPMIVNAFGTEQ